MTAIVRPRSPLDRWSEIVKWSSGVQHQCDCKECNVKRKQHCHHTALQSTSHRLFRACIRLAERAGVAPIVVILKIIFVWSAACISDHAIHAVPSDKDVAIYIAPKTHCAPTALSPRESQLPEHHTGPCITCYVDSTRFVIDDNIAISLIAHAAQSDPQNISRIIAVLDVLVTAPTGTQ